MRRKDVLGGNDKDEVAEKAVSRGRPERRWRRRVMLRERKLRSSWNRIRFENTDEGGKAEERKGRLGIELRTKGQNVEAGRENFEGFFLMRLMSVGM